MAAPKSAVLAHKRAIVARLTQSYPDHHPKLIEARHDLAYEGLAEHAARVVADWPPPTDDQLQRIVALLNTGGDLNGTA